VQKQAESCSAAAIPVTTAAATTVTSVATTDRC
jgi:hypothetical protein